MLVYTVLYTSPRVDVRPAAGYIPTHMMETQNAPPRPATGLRPRRPARVRLLATLLILAAALFGLVQCSARQDITLSVDGSGTADIDVGLDEIFIRYLRDLSGSVGGDENDLRIFDVDEIRRRLSERPGIELTSIGRAGPGLLSLSVNFDDVSALLSEENTDFLELERSGGRSRLEVLVSRDAVEEALSYSPLEGSAVTQMLLPPAEMGTEEYTEYLVWALEEYEESEALRRKIAESSIELRVRVNGEIISQTGGVRSGNTVTFEVPLVELLTLSSPRSYSVEFR